MNLGDAKLAISAANQEAMKGSRRRSGHALHAEAGVEVIGAATTDRGQRRLLMPTAAGRGFSCFRARSRLRGAICRPEARRQYSGARRQQADAYPVTARSTNLITWRAVRIGPEVALAAFAHFGGRVGRHR